MKFDSNKREIISPIEFTDKVQESPISFMANDINNKETFAILKSTQNGKYVRGNMLFYNMKGVEIYTDIDNIIFVDLENNTLFIREYKKAINEITTQSNNPELKQYIVLYVDLGYKESSDEEFPLRWELYQGRTKTYEGIKSNAPVIDIDKSIVLAETVNIKDALSVREFVEYLKNADYIEDDGFDISDYSTEFI